MRQHIEELVLNAINKLIQEKNLSVPEHYPIQVERTRVRCQLLNRGTG